MHIKVSALQHQMYISAVQLCANPGHHSSCAALSKVLQLSKISEPYLHQFKATEKHVNAVCPLGFGIYRDRGESSETSDSLPPLFPFTIRTSDSVKETAIRFSLSTRVFIQHVPMKFSCEAGGNLERQLLSVV